jgi:hypothetical protein
MWPAGQQLFLERGLAGPVPQQVAAGSICKWLSPESG